MCWTDELNFRSSGLIKGKGQITSFLHDVDLQPCKEGGNKPTGGATDYLSFCPNMVTETRGGRGENSADKRVIVLQVSDIDVGFASNTELITEP